MTDSHDRAIPHRLNLLIFCIALPTTWALLWVASHLSLGWMLVSAWLFALVNNTLFSLLHEAVHAVLSPWRSVNETIGVLCAPTLPTSMIIQRIAHTGHHRRNRTDAELYDYYIPGKQSRFQRNVLMYGGNLLGLYWFFIPINTLVFLLAPLLYRSKRFIEGPARWLAFEPYVQDIAASPQFMRIWLECLLALIYQVLLFWLLGLTWQGWLLCYWAFALHWSALQYVDHTWSVRDVINGAWNLKVLPISRLIALNYHYHLAHHQNPTLPWTELPHYIDPRGFQPTFWSLYFGLWREGVRPAPPMCNMDGQDEHEKH